MHNVLKALPFRVDCKQTKASEVGKFGYLFYEKRVELAQVI
jgi:hypothetical protein